MIPAFDEGTGNLPPGEHEATWPEVIQRYGWNKRRRLLLQGLRRMLLNLRYAGCTFFLLDGSFVTAKEEPGDFDACCDVSEINVEKLHPVLFSTREEMKAEFGGEVFVDGFPAKDDCPFREFFQKDRDDNPKGIIRIKLETVI